MVKKKLEWLIGVVGPTNIAVSCRLDDTTTLHNWVDGAGAPDSRSLNIIMLLDSLFHDLLASGFDKNDVALFYHSLNDDFDGCSPAVFMRENEPDVFSGRFFRYFSRDAMERASGEAFASAKNHGMTVEEVKGVIDSGCMRELLELSSLGSALYQKEGVERLLREPYDGAGGYSPIELLQRGRDTDLSRVRQITERLRRNV